MLPQKHSFIAWLQVSAVMEMRTALYRVITKGVAVISY